MLTDDGNSRPGVDRLAERPAIDAQQQPVCSSAPGREATMNSSPPMRPGNPLARRSVDSVGDDSREVIATAMPSVVDRLESIEVKNRTPTLSAVFRPRLQGLEHSRRLKARECVVRGLMRSCSMGRPTVCWSR